MGNNKLLDSNFENYEVMQREVLSDIESTGILLKHKKTGARVVLVSNEDNNKVFYIGFRTTPFDSTGVPHIIEHSVLCGSDRYPVKDPFVELAKSSLNTFLNAVTYPDKTLYPVASCNDQDIKNLMDVYMDAVFHPNIYKHEEIFKQEGWHYELDAPEGELKLNGVVYNEMKGAMSDSDELVDQYIQSELYPDTTYGVVSGGDPDVIPELTYEAFLDFHSRYYHPSNSYIFLYGNFDMAERLEWLDREYLSKYDYYPVDSEIKLQPCFDAPKRIVKQHPIGAEEDTKAKTYLSYSVMTGREEISLKENLALNIIDTILFGIPGAPIRQALNDAGIGKGILHNFSSYIRQSYEVIVASYADPEQEEEFVRIIEDGLKEQAEKGLNKDSLLAAINSMDFTYREADTGSTPKGLITGITILDTWLYDDNDVFTNLKQLAVFDELKKEIDTGYFEKLIVDRILNNPHKLVLISEPVPGLTDKKEAELAEKLAAYKAGLSPEEIAKIVEDTAALKLYQDTEDAPEDLAKLPAIKVSDVEKKALPLVNEVRELDGSKVVFHDIATNGIEYISMLFPLSDIDPALTSYVSLASDLIGALSTKNHSYLELANLRGIYSGGLYTTISVFASSKDKDAFSPYISLKIKALPENVKKCFEIGLEMLADTDFSDKKRIKDVIGEIFADRQSKLTSSGHSTAYDRACSYFNRREAYNQMLSGVEYYEFIKDLYENFDERYDELRAKIEYILAAAVRADNMLVSLTCREKEYSIFAEGFSEFKKQLAANEKEAVKPEINEKAYLPEKRNEAFRVSGQVQYCAAAGNYKNAGLKFSGAFAVLKTMLSYEYLWVNVRVKGGAYGCFFSYERLSGNCGMVSYRDPNLKNTYDIYGEAADFVRELDLSQEDIDRYIIGTMSNIDLPKLPRAYGDYSFGMWMQGLTDAELQKERDEILGATPDSIRSLAPIFDAIKEQGYICTVGSAGKINEDAALFKEIKDIN